MTAIAASPAFKILLCFSSSDSFKLSPDDGITSSAFIKPEMTENPFLKFQKIPQFNDNFLKKFKNYLLYKLE